MINYNSIQFNDIESLLQYGYNYIYNRMVYHIIKAGYPYKWINPTKDNLIMPESDILYQDFPIPPPELAKDIVANGMIFPFYAKMWPTGKCSMRQGKHRWCGLCHELIDMDFLCIMYEHTDETLPFLLNMPILDEKTLTIKFINTNNTYEIAKMWYLYSEKIAFLARSNNIKLKSFKIWEDKIKFNSFLNCKNEFEWLAKEWI